MAFSGFCKRCLRAGHQCPAVEGSDDCIFCEDGEACPVTKRQADASSRERPEHRPMLVNDVLRVGRAKAKRRPALVDEIGEFISQKEEVMQETCKCGKLARHRGRCKGINPITGVKAKPAQSGKTVQAKPEAAAVEAPPVADRAVVSLLVSEPQIDAMFCAWPLEEKLLCVQDYFDRHAAR